MDYFEYRNGRLFCENVVAADIAAQFGTPVYVYSTATLLHHYNAFAAAFAELEPTICFSIKTLANVNILKLLAAAGSGFDVTSGGELARARAAGGAPEKIVYAGVGKTDREITDAIAAGIGIFNVESEEECENLSRIAHKAGKTVHAALRINPDVYDPKTHDNTATGRKGTKFGVDIDRAEAFFQKYGGHVGVRLDGIHLHLGSPIYTPEPYVQAITKTLRLIDRLRTGGMRVEILDIGGGYAADYETGEAPTASDYAAAIVPLLKGRGLRVILEPGRQIACNAGILLTQVLYTKQGGERKFVIVDAAMTDLIRPALYKDKAKHFIWPASLPVGQTATQRRFDLLPPDGQMVDVVGGVCEGTDFLAKDRVLPPMRRGDLVAVFSAGAYGFVMSSQYNSRPRSAEVLVNGDKSWIIRRRETYEDLFEAEMQSLVS
jgi:diaminopimelate decarboxylase